MRHGIYKNHGWKSLVRESDRVRIQFAQRTAGPRIVIEATATRATESSYQYEMQFTPEDIPQAVRIGVSSNIWKFQVSKLDISVSYSLSSPSSIRSIAV
jgi:hypothetical protein